MRLSVPTTKHYSTKNTAREAQNATLPKTVLLALQQKRAIIDEVIEGRLPLWEAAPRFQAAHAAASQCMESATGVPNPLPDSETLCRTIIGWVHLSLSDRPETADRISDRLESELREHLNLNR
jgi:hypothetical protein